MKNLKFFVLCACLFSFVFVFVGCGKDDPAAAASASGTSYLSVSRSTLPLLSSNPGFMEIGSDMMDKADPSWMTWGNMADEAAFIFLDPEVWPSLGSNNIYHLINNFGTIPTTAAASFSSVVAVPWFETHDASSATFFPTAFSKAYTEYQSTENYVAQVGTTTHIMRAFTGGGGSRASSVFQVIYDTATNNIQARFQGAWDYTADFSNAFVMRFEFFGTSATHAFTLRVTKWNSTPGYYYTQIVGKGISQGAGAYFLFKIKDNSLGGGAGNVLGTAFYYCYDATTGLATNVTGAVAGSNCASYETDVDAITGLIYTDMPTTDVFATTVTTTP